MPISSRRAPGHPALLGLALALALAGCEGGLGPGGAPESLAVAGGAVIVAGPEGYCVDRRLSRPGPDEAFVALGSCAALSRGAAAPAGQPAVLTATVSADPLGATPDLAELERFLRSDTGRAALSRAGRADTVTIRDVERRAGSLMLMIRDSSAAVEGPPTRQIYWRAVMVLNDRLVTATVMAFADRPLSRDAGFRRLGDFVTRLRAANAPPG